MMGNRHMVFHALLTDITLDHAQRISIDPEEAAAWGSRTKFIYEEHSGAKLGGPAPAS